MRDPSDLDAAYRSLETAEGSLAAAHKFPLDTAALIPYEPNTRIQ